MNTKKFNLIELMKKEYSGRNNYEKINLSFAKNLKDYGYLYQDPKNRLYVSKLRGFEANKLIDFLSKIQAKKLKLMNEFIIIKLKV